LDGFFLIFFWAGDQLASREVIETKREERTGTGGLIPLFEDQENFGIREAWIGTGGKA
jgi:hypothetical protein